MIRQCRPRSDYTEDEVYNKYHRPRIVMYKSYVIKKAVLIPGMTYYCAVGKKLILLDNFPN